MLAPLLDAVAVPAATAADHEGLLGVRCVVTDTASVDAAFAEPAEHHGHK
ncbi:hypothetical protein [Nocardia vulneris]